MVKGLDAGTVNIVLAEKQEGSAAFARQRNAYLDIDDNELTRAMFDSARVLFMEKDGKTLILGEDAVKLASILKREVVRPVKHGLITPEDKDSLSTLKVIGEKIVPPAEDNEIMCISSPAKLIDSHIDVNYHKKTLKAMAKKWGYEVIQIDDGLAVIYSELGKHSFTGVGISVGAGYTTVTVACRATPIASFSLAKGGDWIEKEAASATGLSKYKVNSIKEDNFSLDSQFEMGSVEGALNIYYEALVNYILSNFQKELTEVDLPQTKFPVVIAGGTAHTEGFVELFKEKLSESELPLTISSVGRAREPIYTVARGCLISALTTQSATKGNAETKTKTATKTGNGGSTGTGTGTEKEAGIGTETVDLRPKREPKRISISSRKHPPQKILARSMANKPCVSSDGVVVGTVHNFTVDTDSGSLKDLWIKPRSNISFLSTYRGLYVIPFENVRSTEEYIVIKTLKVE